eukprot:GHVS01083334.1.p1 GENE.GHVS01083334.1~~GHVS01083334.1.p1  ORF type:complete len:1420 (-),score=279.27 GHVS01083334.1:60-4070(-)
MCVTSASTDGSSSSASYSSQSAENGFFQKGHDPFSGRLCCKLWFSVSLANSARFCMKLSSLQAQAVSEDRNSLNGNLPARIVNMIASNNPPRIDDSDEEERSRACGDYKRFCSANDKNFFPHPPTLMLAIPSLKIDAFCQCMGDLVAQNGAQLHWGINVVAGVKAESSNCAAADWRMVCPTCVRSLLCTHNDSGTPPISKFLPILHSGSRLSRDQTDSGSGSSCSSSTTSKKNSVFSSSDEDDITPAERKVVDAGFCVMKKALDKSKQKAPGGSHFCWGYEKMVPIKAKGLHNAVSTFDGQSLMNGIGLGLESWKRLRWNSVIRRMYNQPYTLTEKLHDFSFKVLKSSPDPACGKPPRYLPLQFLRLSRDVDVEEMRKAEACCSVNLDVAYWETGIPLVEEKKRVVKAAEGNCQEEGGSSRRTKRGRRGQRGDDNQREISTDGCRKRKSKRVGNGSPTNDEESQESAGGTGPHLSDLQTTSGWMEEDDDQPTARAPSDSRHKSDYVIGQVEYQRMWPLFVLVSGEKHLLGWIMEAAVETIGSQRQLRLLVHFIRKEEKKRERQREKRRVEENNAEGEGEENEMMWKRYLDVIRGWEWSSDEPEACLTVGFDELPTPKYQRRARQRYVAYMDNIGKVPEADMMPKKAADESDNEEDEYDKVEEDEEFQDLARGTGLHPSELARRKQRLKAEGARRKRAHQEGRMPEEQSSVEADTDGEKAKSVGVVTRQRSKHLQESTIPEEEVSVERKNDDEKAETVGVLTRQRRKQLQEGAIPEAVVVEFHILKAKGDRLAVHSAGEAENHGKTKRVDALEDVSATSTTVRLKTPSPPFTCSFGVEERVGATTTTVMGVDTSAAGPRQRVDTSAAVNNHTDESNREDCQEATSPLLPSSSHWCCGCAPCCCYNCAASMSPPRPASSSAFCSAVGDRVGGTTAGVKRIDASPAATWPARLPASSLGFCEASAASPWQPASGCMFVSAVGDRLGSPPPRPASICTFGSAVGEGVVATTTTTVKRVDTSAAAPRHRVDTSAADDNNNAEINTVKSNKEDISQDVKEATSPRPRSCSHRCCGCAPCCCWDCAASKSPPRAASSFTSCSAVGERVGATTTTTVKTVDTSAAELTHPVDPYAADNNNAEVNQEVKEADRNCQEEGGSSRRSRRGRRGQRGGRKKTEMSTAGCHPKRQRAASKRVVKARRKNEEESQDQAEGTSPHPSDLPTIRRRMDKEDKSTDRMVPKYNPVAMMQSGFCPYIQFYQSSVGSLVPELVHDQSFVNRYKGVPYLDFKHRERDNLGLGMTCGLLYSTVARGSVFPLHCEQGALGATNQIVGCHLPFASGRRR